MGRRAVVVGRLEELHTGEIVLRARCFPCRTLS